MPRFTGRGRSESIAYSGAFAWGCRVTSKLPLERTMEAGLCIEALQKALRRRHPQAGLIHHSDRGVQYCSKEYVAVLAEHGIRGSMARKGNPFDNALAESFWKTLKYEQVYRDEYGTLEQARASIGNFIERVYNQRRLHSALGYCPPAEFEATLRAGGVR